MLYDLESNLRPVLGYGVAGLIVSQCSKSCAIDGVPCLGSMTGLMAAEMGRDYFPDYGRSDEEKAGSHLFNSDRSGAPAMILPTDPTD